MNLLAGTYYDPAVAVNKVATALLAMTVLDNVNLRLTFTAPASGRVKVIIRGGCIHGAVTFPQVLIGCIENSPAAGTVRGRQAPQGGGFNGTALATTQLPVAVEYLITGLTPGQAYTWDLAYGVEILLAATGWKYGGPNNATTNDAFGGISFEIWDPSPAYTPAAGVPPTTTLHQKLDAIDDFIDTEIAAIIAALVVIDDFLDTEIAAIKAKTDGLPADPADASDLLALLTVLQADTDDIQSRLPAALVGGRMAANAEVVGDKTGYALTAAERASIADRILLRNIKGGSDAGRLVHHALAALRNRWEIAAGVLTVYDADDVTPLFTAAITRTAGDPITHMDPA